MGAAEDDLPEVELIEDGVGDESGTDAPVGVRPHSRVVWLVVGIVVLGVGAVISSIWGGAAQNEAESTTTSVPVSSSSPERPDASLVPAAAHLPTYDLALAGAILLREETSRPTGLPVTVWAHAGAYLSLSVRPGEPVAPGTGQRPRPCADATAPVAWLPDAQGSAWVSIPPAGPTAALCWHRASGNLWMLRAYWNHDTPSVADREERVRLWSLAIRPAGPDGANYVLEDQQMRAIASDRGGLTHAEARVWDYGGGEIVLFVIENRSASGLSNLLATGPTRRVDMDGLGEVWITRTRAGWVVPTDQEIWATLSVPPDLASDLERILQQLEGPVTPPAR